MCPVHGQSEEYVRHKYCCCICLHDSILKFAGPRTEAQSGQVRVYGSHHYFLQ